MYTLYKDGKQIGADKDQLSILMEEGWATTKPAEVSDESSEKEDEEEKNRRLSLE